jgi:hypothetical protein
MAVPPQFCCGANPTLPLAFGIDTDFLHRFLFLLFSPDILIAAPYKSWGEKRKKGGW